MGRGKIDCTESSTVTGVSETKPMFARDASSVPVFAALDIDSLSFTDKPRVLDVFATILNRIVASNEVASPVNTAADDAAEESQLTVFDGLRAPGITIEKYFDRIFKYAHCSPSCYVMAYIYIDRIMQRKDAMLITSRNVHRLLITSVLVAAKFMEDAYYNNAYYAKVGGISLEEMNRLELEFLFRLSFRLNVTQTEFTSYCHVLHEHLLAAESSTHEDETLSSRSYGFFLPHLLASTLGSGRRTSGGSTCNSNSGDAGDSSDEIAGGDSSRSDGDSNCGSDSSTSDGSSIGIGGGSSSSSSPASSSTPSYSNATSPSSTCPTGRQDSVPAHVRKTCLTATALSAASSILSFFSPRKPASSAASALPARPGSAPASVTSSRLVTTLHAVTIDSADSGSEHAAGACDGGWGGSGRDNAGSGKGGAWLRSAGVSVGSGHLEVREPNEQWWFGSGSSSGRGVGLGQRTVLVSN